MRFHEFTPILTEFVDTKDSNQISSLDDLKELVIDNPEVAADIDQILKSIMARLPKPAPQNTQVTTDKPAQPQVQRPEVQKPNTEIPGAPVQEQMIGQEVQTSKTVSPVNRVSIEQVLLTIDDFGDDLAGYSEEQQQKLIELVNLRITQKVAPKIEQAKKEGGEEKEKEISAKTSELKKLAIKIANDKGMNEAWGKILYGFVNEFENNFAEKFLTHVSNGTALNQSWETIASVPMNKTNLKNLVNSELAELFNPENSKPFDSLKSLPLATSTGPGQGSGPGETILALLVPGANKAGKGDLKIGDDMWEIKGGSYSVAKNSLKTSNAWLDCSNIKATGLRIIFQDVIHDYLKKSWSKLVSAGDRKMTLSELSRLADFRPSSIWAMAYLFKQLKPEQRYTVLDKMYDAVFPTLKKKYPKVFDSSIRLSAEAILQQDTENTLSNLHAKLAMLEYQAGPYKAKGIVVFNKTTNDIMVLQGIKGINSGMATGALSTQTLTIQGKGDAKAHPGIFLSSDRSSIEQQLGIQRTRDYKPKVRQFRENQ